MMIWHAMERDPHHCTSDSDFPAHACNGQTRVPTRAKVPTSGLEAPARHAYTTAARMPPPHRAPATPSVLRPSRRSLRRVPPTPHACRDVTGARLAILRDAATVGLLEAAVAYLEGKRPPMTAYRRGHAYGMVLCVS